MGILLIFTQSFDLNAYLILKSVHKHTQEILAQSSWHIKLTIMPVSLAYSITADDMLKFIC